ncbi:hypothetical protein LY76DRAFT_193480 [Colletotrichum caudatum]|nr:hypothetical protein LY76DRAFT_193480 [Colletotrichum caudatum]
MGCCDAAGVRPSIGSRACGPSWPRPTPIQISSPLSPPQIPIITSRAITMSVGMFSVDAQRTLEWQQVVCSRRGRNRRIGLDIGGKTASRTRAWSFIRNSLRILPRKMRNVHAWCHSRHRPDYLSLPYLSLRPPPQKLSIKLGLAISSDIYIDWIIHITENIKGSLSLGRQTCGSLTSKNATEIVLVVMANPNSHSSSASY